MLTLTAPYLYTHYTQALNIQSSYEREPVIVIFLRLHHLIWYNIFQIFPFSCKFQILFFFTVQFNSIVRMFHIYIIHPRKEDFF